MLARFEHGFIPLILDQLYTLDESKIYEFALIDLFKTNNLLNVRKGNEIMWCDEYEKLNGYLAINTIFKFFVQLKKNNHVVKKYVQLSELTRNYKIMIPMRKYVSGEDKELFDLLIKNNKDDESDDNSAVGSESNGLEYETR